MPDDRSYEDEDVRAIIDRALAAKPKTGLSHDDLLAVGEGVGLSKADMELAARQVAVERVDRQARASVLGKRKKWLALHAGAFALLNGFFFLINFLTTPGEWWFLFPVFGWGLALALHAAFGFSKQVSAPALERARRSLKEAPRLRVADSAVARTAEEPQATQEEVGESRPTRATLPK